MSTNPPTLPPDVEIQLDRMLATWAAARQITPSRAETIRRDILHAAPTSEPERKGEWMQAISPPAMIGANAFPPVLATVYRTLADVVPGWPTPSIRPGSEYVPYLQVA